RAMALSLLSGMIMMANPVTAANLPTGGQIVAGSGSIQTPSGNQMNIIQNSQNMVANWNSFDIGKGNTVQFYQPNSSAVALNRVVGGGESKIMGNLKANGQVFLVNPNG
ncbi:TPA: filamentous hemagglutinin N-terminal domain-containing protein, partial [Escherichia coli]|nr:filamentous hemagglutinin N-terminal domain-containing protein [Escherichia coli]HBH4745528.1 filamentous hemagglutinin N-terminal domain-containing protein [Escherichia coli]